MAYNGIGLASVRGSGTSGYVQTNKFHVRASRLGPRDSLRDRDDLSGAGARKPNQEILEHNRKRAVEIKLLLLRESLEAAGCVRANPKKHMRGRLAPPASPPATRARPATAPRLTGCRGAGAPRRRSRSN
jgi:serine/arginine repetitive matrix protein 2